MKPPCVTLASAICKGDVRWPCIAAMLLYCGPINSVRTIRLLSFSHGSYGKLRAVARRSHNPRRQTASYYQPLMLLNIIVFGRPSQPLYRINTVDIVHALRPLHEDFTLLRSGLYMTELVRRDDPGTACRAGGVYACISRPWNS